MTSVADFKHMRRTDRKFAKSSTDCTIPQLGRVDTEIRPTKRALDDHFPDARDAEKDVAAPDR